MRFQRAISATTIAVATLAGVVGPATDASAATPRCVYNNYVYSVGGGCDGLGGAGHDRMNIRCRVNNSGFWVDWYGAWHDRYGSWQEIRACGGGWHAWQVLVFEYKNN